MFVDCSAIIISIIVKDEPYIGIIEAFCLPEGTYYSFRTWRKKIAGLWFAKGISTQADNMS